MIVSLVRFAPAGMGRQAVIMFISVAFALLTASSGVHAKGTLKAQCSSTGSGSKHVFQCSDKGLEKWMNSLRMGSDIEGRAIETLLSREARKNPPQASQSGESGDGRTIDITITIFGSEIEVNIPCCKGKKKDKKKKKKDKETGEKEAPKSESLTGS